MDGSELADAFNCLGQLQGSGVLDCFDSVIGVFILDGLNGPDDLATSGALNDIYDIGGSNDMFG